MPITKDQLQPLVAEIGFDGEKAEQFMADLLANQEAATKFVGQRLRHEDYTKKTTQVAEERKQLEKQATEQITQYANQLRNSQAMLDRVMKDLEAEKISTYTANQRLQRIKETYQLSDDDIPALETKNPAGTGGTQTLDIESKLSEFGSKLKADLIRSLQEDMLALPRITAVQSDIQDEHRELVGKRLTRAEMNDLLAEAEKGKRTLVDVWESKYDIGKLRTDKSDADKKARWLKEWEDKQTAERTEKAISGVRDRFVDSTKPITESRIFTKDFSRTDPADGGSAADKSKSAAAGKKTGAERAAEAYMARRAKGVKFGATE